MKCQSTLGNKVKNNQLQTGIDPKLFTFFLPSTYCRVVAKIKLFSLKFCAPRSKKGKNSKSETSLEVKKIDANSKFMFRLWCAEEIGTFFATASFWKRILASAKSQNVCAKNHI